MVAVAAIATFLVSLHPRITLRFRPEINHVYRYDITTRYWSQEVSKASQALLWEGTGLVQDVLPSGDLTNAVAIDMEMTPFGRFNDETQVTFQIRSFYEMRGHTESAISSSARFISPIMARIDSRYRVLYVDDTIPSRSLSLGGSLAGMPDRAISPGETWIYMMPLVGSTTWPYKTLDHAPWIPVTCTFQGMSHGYARLNTSVFNVTISSQPFSDEDRIWWQGTYLVDIKTGVFVKGYTRMHLIETHSSRTHEFGMIQTFVVSSP